jgi:large subunit ribosomal protein L13
MRSAAMKSYMADPEKDAGQWYVVDADQKVLGRLAARLATMLMGKHKPTYTPHVPTGDFVVVVNAEKIKLTGRKIQQKTYDRYSYYTGGRKVVPAAEVMDRHPERIIHAAVRRMLPKTKLGTQMLKRLKVYAGPNHPHQAQKPEPLEVNV